MKQLKIFSSITSRNYPAFDIYLNEVNRIPMISPEEEVELSERYQINNDQNALDKLICSNLRFVISVAKQYERQGLTLPDLVNEGNFGLITAAQKFDHTRGFKFISYAVWWIRQSIMQAISENGRLVRIPSNQISLANKVNNASMRFIAENQRQASPQEIANILGISEQKVIEAIENVGIQSFSIDRPLGEDNDSQSLLDIIPSNKGSEADKLTNTSDLSIALKESLATLCDRENKIIRMIFGIGQEAKSLDDVANEVKLTRERVRQIKDKAILRLKANCGNKLCIYL